MNIFYVYVLFRPWDGSPFYVGKGKGDRWRDHERPSENHPNRHLMNVIKKAKRLNLEIPKVKIRENLTELEAFEIEKSFIAAIGRGKSGPLVNLTDGGEGSAGWKHPPEWRALMSQLMTGKPGPKGVKRSAETREKLRLIASRRTAEVKASHGNKKRGGKLTLEHRLKLRDAKLGKRLSAAHRANIGKAHLGKKRSVEARKRMRQAMTRDPTSGRWLRNLD